MCASFSDKIKSPLWRANYPLPFKVKCLKNLCFVVCGSARSGTGFLSKAFNQVGISCGHEAIFGFSLSLDEENRFGESSWLSLPVLPHLPEGIVLLHVVRNPVKVVKSLIRRFMFASEGEKVINKYDQFALRNMGREPFIREFALYQEYWIAWNRMIELAGEGRPYYRFRVEDFSSFESGVFGRILEDFLGVKGRCCII